MQLLKPVHSYLHHMRLFTPSVRRFLVANLFIGLGGAFFQVLLNLLLDALGVSKATMGDIQGAQAAGMALCAVPVAALYDRLPVRGLFVGSVVLGAVALGVMAATPARPILLFAAVLVGVAMSVHAVAAAPFLMRHTGEKERVFAFGLSFATEILASIAGAALAGWLPGFWGAGSVMGMRLALILGAVLVGLAAWPYWGIREAARAEGPAPRWPLAGATRGQLRLYARMIAPDALIGVGAGITIPFLNVYLKERFHLDSHGVGLAFSATSAFMVVGVLAGPILGQRFGLVRTVVGTQLLSVPFMVALALTFDLRVAIAAVMVRAALMNMGHPMARAFQMELVGPAEQATVNSLTMLGWNGGWILGTALGGRLIASQGFTTSILVTSAIYVVSTLLYLLCWSERRYLVIGMAKEKPAGAPEAPEAPEAQRLALKALEAESASPVNLNPP